MPISTKFCTTHPWWMKSRFVQMNGHALFLGGWRGIKIHWRNLKIFISRTTGPNSTKLGKTSLNEEYTRLFKLKGHAFFAKVVNKKYAKIHLRNLKFSSSWTTGPFLNTKSHLLELLGQFYINFMINIIIALLKCFHRFEMVSHVSDVTHESLVSKELYIL